MPQNLQFYTTLTNKSECFQNSVAIETGVSDHHKLIATVLKTHLNKLKPTIIKYRKFKTMDEFNFKSELLHTAEANVKDNMNYDEFKKHFPNAPLKQKVKRGNNAPFMNKTLSKAFIERSKLKNRCNKDPTEVNKTLYNKQRNFCVNLLRKEKKKIL